MWKYMHMHVYTNVYTHQYNCMPTSRRMSKLIVVYLYNRTLKISEIRNTRVTNINIENLTNLLIEKKSGKNTQ